MMRIGIQGLAASYSDAALSILEPTAMKTLYDSFADVFEGLRSGKIDKAFLPFENSTAGFIAENFHRLDKSGFYVTGEYIHRIEHCLLAPRGTKIEEIEVVHSHPQALAQCTHKLRQLGLRSEGWFDTAGAARDVALTKNKAAIASADAAKVYGLEILKKGMNDEPENFTRFFTIGKELVWGQRILVECDVADLMSLATHDVKLVTMLTHPEPAMMWGHAAYVELEKRRDLSWQEWLKQYASLKVLGSFDGKR